MNLQDGWVKTGLRLPAEIHTQLQESAMAARRTLNGEILFRLEGSFSDTQKGNAPTAATVEASE